MDSNLLRNHVFRSVDSVDVFQSYAHSTQDGTSRHVSSPNWSESKHWHLTLQMQRFVKVSNTDTHLQLGHGFTRYTGTQSLANAKAAPQSRLLLPLSLHFLILSFLLSTSSNWFWHQQRHQHCHCNAARGSYHILSWSLVTQSPSSHAVLYNHKQDVESYRSPNGRAVHLIP